MDNREYNHTEEHKQANAKKIKVGDKEKLLLMDDEDVAIDGVSLTERDVQGVIEAMVYDTLDEMCGCGHENESDDDDDRHLYEAFIDEASYPEGFNLDEFKAIRSFAGRVRYAKEHLGNIGSGSSRVVLGIDPGTVIKIARNKKGLAQNEIEADVSRTGYDVIAEVFDEDPDYLYIEMERAKKLKKSDWKRITGYKFDEWMEVLWDSFRKRLQPNAPILYKLRISPEDVETIHETELFNDVMVLLANFDMPVGDIMRPSSWGIVKRDGKDWPVLVDYGLTKQVYLDHYS